MAGAGGGLLVEDRTFPLAIEFLAGPSLVGFLAIVLCTFADGEDPVAVPDLFAAFALPKRLPALEPVMDWTLGVPLVSALEPTGEFSAFEALRKERPIAAGATTLGAIAIE